MAQKILEDRDSHHEMKEKLATEKITNTSIFWKSVIFRIKLGFILAKTQKPFSFSPSISLKTIHSSVIVLLNVYLARFFLRGWFHFFPRRKCVNLSCVKLIQYLSYTYHLYVLSFKHSRYSVIHSL